MGILQLGNLGEGDDKLALLDLREWDRTTMLFLGGRGLTELEVEGELKPAIVPDFVVVFPKDGAPVVFPQPKIFATVLLERVGEADSDLVAGYFVHRLSKKKRTYYDLEELSPAAHDEMTAFIAAYVSEAPDGALVVDVAAIAKDAPGDEPF